MCYYWEELWNYAVEIELSAMIKVRVPGFIQICLGFRKLMRRTHTDTHTHTQEGDLIRLLPFFQNKENMLINTLHHKCLMNNSVIK